jgi:hypothetical protein
LTRPRLKGQQSPWKWLDLDNKSLCVHSIYTPMATLPALWQICFVLFGSQMMVMHPLCVYKSLKASSLSLVPSRSSPVPVLHLQRTGSSQSIFPFYFFPNSLGWSYVFSLRSPSFLSRCSPSRSLPPYSSSLQYPPLMLMLASILLSASKGRWYEAMFSVLPPTLHVAL